MTSTDNFGPPILVNGVQPDFVAADDIILFENTRDYWLRANKASVYAWSSEPGQACPIHIRLREDHPFYRSKGINWAKPIEAYRPGEPPVPLTVDYIQLGDTVITEECPCSATANHQWHYDGTSWCFAKIWHVRNVDPILAVIPELEARGYRITPPVCSSEERQFVADLLADTDIKHLEISDTLSTYNDPEVRQIVDFIRAHLPA